MIRLQQVTISGTAYDAALNGAVGDGAAIYGAVGVCVGVLAADGASEVISSYSLPA